MKQQNKKIVRVDMLSKGTTHMATDKVAGRIAQGLISLQEIFSRYMKNRTGSLSSTGLKIIVCIFFVTAGAVNGWLIVEGLRSEVSGIQALPAMRGGSRHKLSVAGGKPQALYSEGTYSKIQLDHLQWYLHYMDSLKADPAGRARYDSIMFIRPRLLDSIKMVLQLYRPPDPSHRETTK